MCGAYCALDRVAHDARDVAQPRRTADHRPVEKAGAIAAGDVDEQVAEVGIAVHEGARSRIPQRDDLGRAREIQLGDTMEVFVEPVAESVDRHPHERGPATRVARTTIGEPLEIAARIEAR